MLRSVVPRQATSFITTPAARVIKPSRILFNNHVRTNASSAAVRPNKTVEAEPKTSRPRIVTPTSSAKEDLSKQIATMTDDEVIALVDSGKLRFFNLENDVGNYERAVHLRRMIVERKSGRALKNLPYQNYNYESIHGQCCENVIGIVGIPVGVAGPLIVDGKEYFIPMATTEGALIASTTRGCKALSVCGGVSTELVNEGMTRAPVLQCPSAKVAAQVKQFVESNMEQFKASFNATSRFARLQDIKVFIAGRKVYLRFKAVTGDAMGMNMTGKGVDQALALITDAFENVEVLALSGNVCTDKKPSAVNWIEGRGKSVIAEAVIRGEVVESVLKSSVSALVELNYAKNLLGSAVAGSIGGLNAHASNVVTAMFLATGQDPAQNVESSTCITLMEPENDGKDLYVSVTMPSLEVGTVGGGTSLPGQAAMLELLGVKGAHSTNPGENARTLARVIASTVMAGELSLMSALSSGHLISSHLKLNRKHAAPAAAPVLNLTTPLSASAAKSA